MRYYKYLNINSIKAHEKRNKYNELTKSNFWMSSYKELNDPLENFYNVVFDGNFINWICFVRQYLFSLLLYIDTKSEKVFHLNSYTLAMKSKKLRIKYKNIIEKVLKDKETIIFCNNLSNKKNSIVEIKVWFRYLHYYWLYLLDIGSRFKNRNLWNEVTIHAKNLVEQILYNNRCKSFYEKEFRILLNDAYIEKSIKGEKDAEYQYIVLSKFTELYFNSIIVAMVPEFLIYSLSRNYNVSLMWSHYANEHKGICLEYNIDNKLNTFIEGNECKQCYIRNVSYDNNYFPLNFFTDNIMFLIDDMRKDYHFFNKNNTTKFFQEYDEKDFEKTLKTLYIGKLTTKTKGWSYEKETRILFQEKDISKHIEGKQFSYTYNSLKSVTFGLKTTMQDIIYICEKFKLIGKKMPIFYKCIYKYNFKTGKFLLKRYRIKKTIINGLLK